MRVRVRFRRGQCTRNAGWECVWEGASRNAHWREAGGFDGRQKPTVVSSIYNVPFDVFWPPWNHTTLYYILETKVLNCGIQRKKIFFKILGILLRDEIEQTFVE